jgi:hypothetical protein
MMCNMQHATAHKNAECDNLNLDDLLFKIYFNILLLYIIIIY